MKRVTSGSNEPSPIYRLSGGRQRHLPFVEMMGFLGREVRAPCWA